MRSIFTQISLLFVALIGFNVQAQDINWISWEEAVQLSQTDAQPKKIFVDVYMQDNFYMVKMDAEGKDPIQYQGKTFKFVPSGRRGYHELAAALLQGKMSYPTVVFLDENFNMLSPVPGYQKVEPFMQIAKYFGDNIYKDKDWQSYAGK